MVNYLYLYTGDVLKWNESTHINNCRCGTFGWFEIWHYLWVWHITFHYIFLYILNELFGPNPTTTRYKNLKFVKEIFPMIKNYRSIILSRQNLVDLHMTYCSVKYDYIIDHEQIKIYFCACFLSHVVWTRWCYTT